MNEKKKVLAGCMIESFLSLTISLVNSSDDMAYLPVNCFFTNVSAGVSSFKLVELASPSSLSLTSLQLYMRREYTSFSAHPHQVNEHLST